MIARRLTALAAGVLVIAAALGAFTYASGGPQRSQTVRVTIRHSRFIPAHFTVRQGATIRFIITNTDPIDHEFILGDDGVQRRHEDGTEPEHGHVPGEVTVRAGMVAETTYTFSQTGALLIGCHAPGHYAYGMKGWVRVTE